MTKSDVDLATLSPSQLLRLYSRILDELIHRRIIWSRNAPAGDYAELLVAEAYHGKVARGSNKSWDVLVDGAGSEGSERTIQVKCRVIDPDGRRSHTFSPFRSFDFDMCIFVLLNARTYEISRAIEVTTKTVTANARDVAWVAGKRLTVSQVLALTGTVDVTERLRNAQGSLDIKGRSAGVVD